MADGSVSEPQLPPIGAEDLRKNKALLALLREIAGAGCDLVEVDADGGWRELEWDAEGRIALLMALAGQVKLALMPVGNLVIADVAAGPAMDWFAKSFKRKPAIRHRLPGGWRIFETLPPGADMEAAAARLDATSARVPGLKFIHNMRCGESYRVADLTGEIINEMWNCEAQSTA